MIEKICEELDITPEELVIENIIKQNQQLKHNWKELKKWLEEQKEFVIKDINKNNSIFRTQTFVDVAIYIYDSVSNKMQELEKESDVK